MLQMNVAIILLFSREMSQKSLENKPNFPPPEIEYNPPDWVGIPPFSYHLKVYKDNQLLEILLIDDKPYFLLGKMHDCVDFPIDHQSCSRVHAVLAYHKFINKWFITDLSSTHGTYIGRKKIEPMCPVMLELDCSIKFGASTRIYILKDKSSLSIEDQHIPIYSSHKLLVNKSSSFTKIYSEFDSEMEKCTMKNTDNNKIINCNFSDNYKIKKKSNKKNLNIKFSDESIIINPEDVDENIGKFRNMVQYTIIGSNKIMTETVDGAMKIPSDSHHKNIIDYQLNFSKNCINSAPNVEDPNFKFTPAPKRINSLLTNQENVDKKRKKYAKESWPKRKEGLQLY